MFRARATIPAAMALLAAALIVGVASDSRGAGYALSRGFPWAYPPTAATIAPYTELTLTGFSVDPDGVVWAAGNISALGFQRDVYAVTFSGTVGGKMDPTGFIVLGEPGFGYDEGPPALIVSTMPAIAYPLRIEAYLAYSSFNPLTFQPSMALTRVRGLGIYALPVASTTVYDGLVAYPKSAAPAVALNGTATPFTAGTVTVGATDHLVYLRHLISGNPVFEKVISATWWSGSTASVSPRAVVADPGGVAWIVAEYGGDVMLFRYLDESYSDVNTGDFKGRRDPAYPKVFPSAGADDPKAATRDLLGNLWVVGAVSGRAAVWKFRDGALVPGFPVFPSVGSGSTLYGAAVDENYNLVAVGASDGRVLLTGVDQAGKVMPAMPVLWSAAPDTVEGRGLSLVSGGAVWLGASITASPSSTIWFGSALRILRYDFIPSPPEVPSGAVRIRGPGGQVLNPLKRETVDISANASRAGLLKVQIMTLRGEVVREFSDMVGIGVRTFTWDGTNSAGQPLSAGTYAIRVDGAGIKDVQRVVVVRRK